MFGSRFREIGAGCVGEFVARGIPASRFFPHRVYYLPKCGPDGFKLAERMCGGSEPNEIWEVVLYAIGRVLEEFPAELFADDELVWHRQQFGRPGQIASANLLLRGRELHSMVHLSDVVQRIARRREHKTRIENRFKGWVQMLLNAIVNFAIEHDVERLCVPTADLARQHTDPRRDPGRELFERIYDRTVRASFEVEEVARWWTIDVRRAAARVVRPVIGEEPATVEKVVAICHDVERGLGHRDVDPAFAVRADAASPASLTEMLAIEHDAGVRGTYAVVGEIFGDVQSAIGQGGHALAFHSFDHGDGGDQLGRCRTVDYRLKGYRLARSRPTPETTDANLLFHNFEWLGSSVYSFGFDRPKLENRLVKIPIAFDDFPLYARKMPFDAWEKAALETLDREAFVVFGLHDCYAPTWLPRYAELLRRIRDLATPRTMDEIAAAVTFRHAA